MVVQKPHGTMEYTVSVIGVAWMTIIIPVLGLVYCFSLTHLAPYVYLCITIKQCHFFSLHVFSLATMSVISLIVNLA